jgi:hypothetical protein
MTSISESWSTSRSGAVALLLALLVALACEFRVFFAHGR